MGQRRAIPCFVLVLSAILVAGCAGRSDVTATPSGSDEATMSAAPASQDAIVIIGTVEAGVEHGCMMLRTDSVLYQLAGSADPLIRPGARLTVRGSPRPDLVTTCQQGIPFQVVEVHAT